MTRSHKPKADTPTPKLGRPTKLTGDVQARVAEGIALGLTYELAAEYGGISYFTFNNWMKLGSDVDPDTDPDNAYLHFLQSIKKAEANLAADIMRDINSARRDGNWQAGAWLAERRWPQMYGRKVQEITGDNGGPIKLRLVRETGFDPTPEIDESGE